jgi:large subunit ribosomal protein L10
VNKTEKERVVADLTEALKAADTLIVADYRGLTMPQIDALRGRLIEHGATFTVVKNTLTRRAAEAAGADALLALLEGPSAIAFIETEGDAVAVAKALADSARETKVLEIRGGVMQGREISASEVDELAKLPPFDILRGQVVGAIVAPISAIAGLVNAPLQAIVGLLDARADQLENQPGADSLRGGVGGQGAPDVPAKEAGNGSEASTAPTPDEPAVETSAEPAEQSEPAASAESSEAPDDTEPADSPETTN